jgi:hypothetical protein
LPEIHHTAEKQRIQQCKVMHIHMRVAPERKNFSSLASGIKCDAFNTNRGIEDLPY